MNYFLNLYKAFLRTSILDSIQYRASGMIWMLGSILEPVIYLVVWSTVARSRGGDVGGYTAEEFAAYYIILMLVNHVTFTWIMQTFQFRIQFGSLSYELLRPVHPIHADISDNIAFKTVQLMIMLPAFFILILFFKPTFNIEYSSLLIAFPVIILAFLIRFFMEWTLALAAFWTTRIVAINQAYFSVMMFLSGRVAPIALMPIWIQSIAEFLPFYYVVAFPVEIITGKLSNQQIIEGVTTQLIWLIVVLTLMRFTWRRAVRNFAAVGS
ncbi:MAG: ABC-2 family transporter protein [Pseudomonadales bacterium]